jgi:hypothetical protein
VVTPIVVPLTRTLTPGMGSFFKSFTFPDTELWAKVSIGKEKGLIRRRIKPLKISCKNCRFIERIFE